jgi:hypothetical protein
MVRSAQSFAAWIAATRPLILAKCPPFSMPSGQQPLPWDFGWVSKPQECLPGSAGSQMRQCFRNYLNPIRKLQWPVIGALRVPACIVDGACVVTTRQGGAVCPVHKGVPTADSSLRLEYVEAVQRRRQGPSYPPPNPMELPCAPVAKVVPDGLKLGTVLTLALYPR